MTDCNHKWKTTNSRVPGYLNTYGKKARKDPLLPCRCIKQRKLTCKLCRRSIFTEEYELMSLKVFKSLTPHQEKIETCFCQSYIDDNDKLQDCTCGKCEEVLRKEF